MVEPKKYKHFIIMEMGKNVFFGGIEDKKVVFWDFLTFTLAVEDKKIYEDVMHG